MQSNFRKNLTFTAVALMAALLAATRVEALGPPTGALTPQCQAYAQALQAAVQSGKTESLAAVQSQLMAQCLASQNSTPQGQSVPAPAVTAAQYQMLLQSMAAQGQANSPRGAAQGFAPSPLPGVAPMQPTLGPKKPGAIRIGVVQPKAQMGQGNSGVNVAEPIRGMISQYLNGPSQEIVPLSAMISSQIDEEAKVKECDYVLYSAISQKIGGGNVAGLLKKAGPISSMIPMLGMAGGVTGAVAGAAAGTAAGTAAAAAASVASTVKAKSEVTFDYKLMVPGNATPVLANTEKSKAKEDGEDVISPFVEHAATVILEAVTKKK